MGTRIAERSRSSSIACHPGVTTRRDRRPRYVLGLGLVGRPLQQRPVAIVAGEDQRVADRRVDVSVRQCGGVQRDLHRVDQQWADADEPPRAGVYALQVGVRAKAAAGAVDRAQLPLDDRPGPRERVGIVDEQDHARAERLPAGSREGPRNRRRHLALTIPPRPPCSIPTRIPRTPTGFQFRLFSPFPRASSWSFPRSSSLPSARSVRSSSGSGSGSGLGRIGFRRLRCLRGGCGLRSLRGRFEGFRGICRRMRRAFRRAAVAGAGGVALAARALRRGARGPAGEGLRGEQRESPGQRGGAGEQPAVAAREAA